MKTLTKSKLLINHDLPKTDKEFNNLLTKLNSQVVRPPILHKGEKNMSEISLRLIFNEVQKKGGFYAVDRCKQWFNVFRLVHLNCADIKKHTSASNMLKRNYKKHLLILEKRQKLINDIKVSNDKQKRDNFALKKITQTFKVFIFHLILRYFKSKRKLTTKASSHFFICSLFLCFNKNISALRTKLF